MQDSTTIRPCSECKTPYPRTSEYWHKNKALPDGLAYLCKVCACARATKHFQDNHDAKVEYAREHYKDNKARDFEKRASLLKRWRKENPLAARAQVRKRRAIQHNAAGTHTAEDVVAQYRAQNGKCWWCEKAVGDDYHADHLIPLTRGGSNAPENIVISCPHCNQSRGNKLPHEWSDRLL